MGPSNGCRLLLLAAVAVALAGAAAVDSVTTQVSTEPPDHSSPNNFKRSMAIGMAVLVTAVFLPGFFSICLRRCGGRGGITHTASRSRSRRTRGGLDRAVLDSFPTIAYADAKAQRAARSSGALECAVCLSEFDDDETLRLLLPGCAHAFHADCIDAWLASHVTCPVCRAVLAPEPPATAVPATEHDDQAVPAAPRHPASMASPEQASVVIDVVAAAAAARETEEQRIRTEEAAELMRIGSVKRALRCKSGRRPAREGFPRSHTTGHSLAAPSPSPSTSDSERYMLRLPEHVLREVVAAGNLRRSASIQTTCTSGRWPNMSVLARTFSARLPAWGSVRRRESDAPPKGAKFAGGSDGKAVEQCDGGACPLGAHV